MQTNLIKQGSKWAIEVVGGPEDETLVKTFDSPGDAEEWRKQVGAGVIEAPVLKPKKAVKAVKVAKLRVGSLKT
tara:strand:- start:2852 stop:3073 length:222 start_codon:yes stop_codon:yes gene_type:complete